MASETLWRATVTYASAPTPITDDQADALVDELPGYVIVRHDGRQIHMSMTVEASTLRKAEDEAHKAARAAWASAFDVVGQPVGVHIITDDEHQRQLTHPDELDLVGITDVAEILSKPDKPMKQQQASELAAKHPDFPPPVASPGGRKVWTRKSIEAFRDRWPRVGGWAGKRAAEAAAG